MAKAGYYYIFDALLLSADLQVHVNTLEKFHGIYMEEEFVFFPFEN